MKKIFYTTLLALFTFTGAFGQIATYVGSGGSSTAVTGYANETVSVLQVSGFGGNTPCSSGGLSGITVSTSWSTYSTAGPRAFIQIKPNTGYQLNVTGFTAGLRSSNTGPVCARFAYSLNNGATWIDDGACHAPNIGSCGTNATSSWSGGALPTAITSTTNGIIVAIFPYQPSNSSGTFQINAVNILGTVVPSNNPPSFAGGTAQSLSVCENTPATSVNSLMSVNDPDVGQTETWTVISGPANGTLAGFPATVVSTGSTITPSGLTYTPSAGYSGNDAFTIQVSDGTAAATTTVAVTVNPLPVAGTITGITDVCVGSATSLSNAAGGGTWSNTNAGISTVSSTGVVAGLSAGSDIISYAVTNGCGTAFTTAAVTVDPLPSVYTISGGGTLCAGSAGYHMLLSGSDVGVNYELYDGATLIGTFPGINNPLDFGLQTAAGTYTVVAVNAASGCTADMTGSGTIIVNPLPTAYMVTGGGVVCSGVPVHVGLNNSDMDINYQLHRGTTLIGSPVPGAGSAIDFGAFGTAGTYTVSAINTVTGCTNNMSDSVVITVASPIVPSVNIVLGNNDTICAGATVFFSAIPANEGATPLYQWSVNGVNAATGHVFSYIPADGDSVSVILTSSAPCALPVMVSHSMIMSVHARELPYVNALVSRANLVCEGEHVTFTAASVYGGGAPAYQWILNGADVASGSTYTYTPVNGDDVYCTMKSSFVCPVVDSVISGTVHMTVVPYILPSVTVTADPGTYISPGQTVTLHAIVTNPPSTALSYEWLIDGVPAAGGNLSTFSSNAFSYPGPDSVTCIVTASGGVCGPLTTFNWVYINIYPSGVSGLSGNTQTLSILPNPNLGDFTIKGAFGNPAASNEEISVQVLDMLGKLVYNGKAILHNGVIDAQVAFGNTIANGRYILNLRTETEYRSLNIVVGR